MNQSTIYRRHEARLARTYALRDDPRPAFLRVLSGLPLTSLIVPAYHPTAKTEKPNSLAAVRPVAIGDYSEETVFSIRNPSEQTALFVTTNAISSRNSASVDIRQMTLQAMLAAGTGAAVGEFLFGGHCSSRNKKRTFLFYPPTASNNHSSSHGNTVFLRRNATSTAADSSSLGLQLMKSTHHPATNGAMNSSVAAAAATKPSTMILPAAATTSVLFGTKVAMTHCLSFSDSSSPDSATSLVSSALAGGVTGMASRLAILPQQGSGTLTTTTTSPFFSRMPISSSSSLLLARQMVAATLYFATYENLLCLRNNSSTNSNTSQTSPSTPRILASGAAAGVVQAAILYSSHGSLQIMQKALRAAPLHAAVFYAYETMRQCAYY